MKRIQGQVEEGEGCWREWKKQDLERQGIVGILCEKDISSVQVSNMKGEREVKSEDQDQEEREERGEERENECFQLSERE